MLTQDRLKKHLSYNPETGVFIWLISKSPRVPVGSIAGYINKKTYTIIMMDNINYPAHRLAWLYMTGKWPKHCIDHIDGNMVNNIFTNLREATQAQNTYNRGKNKNNSTGYKGVFNASPNRTKKFVARIGYNNKCHHIGYYYTAEEAYEAYCEKAKELHGEFFNGGNL